MKLLAVSLAAAGAIATPSVAVATPVAPTHDKPVVQHGKKPTRTVTVFAHRGASGHRPEHTLAAYELAIRQGADVIEPDLVSTKDGVLVARHENEISGTTDVASHPEFADRRTTKVIDGVDVTGWFTEDFTLAELKTLRAVERLPQVRPGNTVYDGRFEIPTFEEVVELAKRESRGRRTIAVAPETKHPTYFRSIGLDLNRPLVRAIRKAGWDRRNAPIVVQSFETSNLKELARWTRVPLVQLTSASGAPYDLVSRGDDTTYADLTTPQGLRSVARYARWIGPDKSQVIPRDAKGAHTTPTSLVADAHRAGLKVVVYTIRNENQFLPTDLRLGTDPNAPGDVRTELFRYFDAGVDGVFADYPDSAVAARAAWQKRR
ncbi:MULTISPECIES: glycerophosphodiester phosphodiesterase [unclassified Aeromicrobium]|uniref:glycerophosphodiester phosphodiesterase n=1 Tax=unclassified Aeromicrobium TaxID=2633570 RepID=UPI000ABA67B6|nr:MULTISPECIES: glycerophosphodiester phosphodiesterase [unclassified Aeromicrobium]